MCAHVLRVSLTLSSSVSEPHSLQKLKRSARSCKSRQCSQHVVATYIMLPLPLYPPSPTQESTAAHLGTWVGEDDRSDLHQLILKHVALMGALGSRLTR